MSNNPEVSNLPLSNLKPRADDIGSSVVIPHVKLNIGTGGGDSQVSSSTPLPTADSNGVIIPRNDYGIKTNPSATESLWTFKLGGASGATVATVLLVYADSTKEDLVNYVLTVY